MKTQLIEDAIFIAEGVNPEFGRVARAELAQLKAEVEKLAKVSKAWADVVAILDPEPRLR